MRKHAPAELVRRVPPGRYLTDEVPVLTYGATPPFDAERWNFRLTEEVEHPLRLGFEEFQGLPRTAQISDFHP